MRALQLRTTALIFLSIILLSSCSGNKKKKSNVLAKAQEVELDFNKVRDELVQTVEQSPSFDDIKKAISNNGSSYIKEITLPVSHREQLLSSNQKAIGLGMYNFDLQYARAFSNEEAMIPLLYLIDEMVEELDLISDYATFNNYERRLKIYYDEPDSLNIIVDEFLKAIESDENQKKEFSNASAYVFLGTNIEALYILAETALTCDDNHMILASLSAQGERFESLYRVVELMNECDKAITPYTGKLQKIHHYFKKHETLGQEELREVAPMIEEARNAMIQ